MEEVVYWVGLGCRVLVRFSIGWSWRFSLVCSVCCRLV